MLQIPWETIVGSKLGVMFNMAMGPAIGFLIDLIHRKRAGLPVPKFDAGTDTPEPPSEKPTEPSDSPPDSGYTFNP
jgi:hypothetical protein